MLFSGISWRRLELFLNKNVDPCYNSIRTKFNEWNEVGAFKLTYLTLLDKYQQQNKSNFKFLFLDSTDIANENYFKEGQRSDRLLKQVSVIMDIKLQIKKH